MVMNVTYFRHLWNTSGRAERNKGVVIVGKQSIQADQRQSINLLMGSPNLSLSRLTTATLCPTRSIVLFRLVPISGRKC